MKLIVEIEREEDGRWIAEVVDLPGVMAYGSTREGALGAAQALALRVLADRGLSPNRSKLIQDERLQRECAKLDSRAEQAAAEEVFGGEVEWTEY